MAALAFRMSLPKTATSRLILGKLILKRADGSSVTYSATSGLPKHQFTGSWVQKGVGCLPPDSIVPKYTVSTKPVLLLNTPGVNGPFFSIAPFSVNVGGGVERGDFGVHFDANIPGSSGCIVLPIKEHFDLFVYEMGKLWGAGTKSLDLVVTYSKSS